MSTQLGFGSNAEYMTRSILDVCASDDDVWLWVIKSIFGNLFCGEETSASLLSIALGFANILALFAGLIIIGYVVIGGAVNTAKEGKLLGGKWSTIWLPIRTALSFGLIIPAKSFGALSSLSAIQIVVIYMLSVSVNTGTFLWNMMVDVVADMKAVFVSTSEADANIKHPAAHIKMMMCAQVLKNVSENPGHPTLQYIKNGRPVVVNQHFKDIDFSNFKGATLIEFGRLGNSFGVCGKQELNAVPISDNAGHKERAMALGLNATDDAVLNSYERSKDLAYALSLELGQSHNNITSIGGLENVESQENDDIPNPNIRIAALHFLNSMYEYPKDLSKSVNEAIRADNRTQELFKKSVKDGGAIMAGAWFFELQDFSMIPKKAIAGAGAPAPQDVLKCNLHQKVTTLQCQALEVFNNKYLIADKLTEIAIGEAKGISSQSRILDKAFDAEFNTEKPSIEGMRESLRKKLAMMALESIGGYGGSGPINTITLNEQMKNPYATMAAIGNGVQKISTGAYIAMGVLNGVGYGAGDSLITGTFGGGIIKGVIITIGYMVFPFIALMIATGFVLTFLIPLMPLLAWILAVVGYMPVMVAVVAAAPLAFMMMATPEGEGISGTRLERSIKLILRATCYPSFLIMGLIAAMTLSNIAFTITNTMFWRFADFEGGLMGIIAFIVIYASLQLSIIKKMTQVITLLPDLILEFISEKMSTDSSTDTIESATNSTGAQLNSASGSAASGAGRGINSIAGKIRNRRKGK